MCSVPYALIPNDSLLPSVIDKLVQTLGPTTAVSSYEDASKIS